MLSIEQRQRSLFYCGFYYTGKIDKIEGALTKKAYELFQKDHGLEVDSIYGPITDRMLIEAVKELQTMLNACGANLIVDGIIGQKTIAAIKAFQKENGLVVDGIAGVKTFTSTPVPIFQVHSDFQSLFEFIMAISDAVGKN